MKKIALLFVCVFGLILTGCVSYTGAIVIPGDDAVDEDNRVHAKQQAEEFAQRQQFKRDVVIKESEELNRIFLSPQYVPRSSDARVNALCSNMEVRRAIAISAKKTLREFVLSLNDFKLFEEAAGQEIVIGSEESEQDKYVITYNISNVDLQLREGKNVINGQITRDWVGNVSVAVEMKNPLGESVFTFNAMGTASKSDDGSLEPNATLLEEAAVLGIKEAMKKYAVKFGPVFYVQETCQNGEFVRINAGTNYGLREGTKIKFFRFRTMEGLDGQPEEVENLVGTGTVAAGGAPLDENSAWVHVDGYNKDARTVFLWTSARVIQGEGSTGNLQLPGFANFGL